MSWINWMLDRLRLPDSTVKVDPEPRWSEPPADVREFVDRLGQVRLASYADELVKLVRESVRLVPSQDADRLGGGRLGGQPDLPVGSEWPSGPNGPLSFILQVNLGDVAPLVPEEGLPATGLLSFFYDTVEQVWGFDPLDRGSWAVIYSAADEELSPRPAPVELPPEARFEPVALDAVQELSFPAAGSHDVHELGIVGSKMWSRYSPVLGEADNSVNRLLGNPEPIQADMQEECQLVSNGISRGNSDNLRDPRAKALMKKAGQWRLLLQVDSVEEAGMMWGDAGRIYFWLKDEDLRAHNWKDSWLVLQCY